MIRLGGCGCKDQRGCFHGPLIPGRILKSGLAQIVENASGYIRLAAPKNILRNPDGSVYLRPE